MEDIETRADEIDIEEVMCKIRANIKNQGDCGIDPNNSIICSEPNDNGKTPPSADIQKDLNYINFNWDVHNRTYSISTHRQVIGKALVKGRNLINGEVRRYVDPMIWKQTDFNSSVVRILNESTKKIAVMYSDLMEVRKSKDVFRECISKHMETTSNITSVISSQIDERLSQTQAKIASELEDRLSQTQAKIASELEDRLSQTQAKIASELEDRLSQTQAKIASELEDRLSQTQAKITSELEDRLSQTQAKNALEIDDKVRVVISAMNEDIENKAWLACVLERRNEKSLEMPRESLKGQNDEINYFVFEEQFRGSRADIKNRQSAFLKYFIGSKNVLDIGCGRGELLELLKEHEIEGRGIDIDENMINFCKSRGFDVEMTDALSYLDRLEDKSLDCIFIDQVVEHLNSDYLIRMLEFCYKKLIYGGTIIVETVNPLSFFSLANFYIDLSHKRPVHPETLRFLMTSVRFRDIETVFISPVTDETRLKKMMKEGLTEGDAKLIDIYNHNIELLNSILYGPQDYMIVAKK
jgi:2-polyprenyl-3-methyl-5-hydroxy-6-metoxy-1,4-benzoquinol methylase